MKKLRIAVFAPAYPNPQLIGNMFVKVRVNEYAKVGHEIRVFTYGKENTEYEYEGIRVFAGSWSYLEEKLAEFPFDRFVGHLIDRRVSRYIVKTGCFSKCLLWIHGFEVLGWYRDVIRWKLTPEFLWGRFRRIIANSWELLWFRYMILRGGSKIRYVFVSRWMRRMSQIDLLYLFPRYQIIPNPIETEVFRYSGKRQPEQRLKVWFMRTYDHHKYAADVALESIRLFSKHPYFKKFEFLITGNGSRFEELTEGLHGFSNIRIEKKYMNHTEIAQAATQYGVFLSPSRQDAQGVSMCEAMSSGMVVISSYSTAIPEFVHPEKTGLLTRSAEEIVEALVRLHDDSALFERLSENAARWVRENLDIQGVIRRELVEIEK